MLTKRLKDTYDFIRTYIIKNGIAPTGKEIASGIGIISRGVAARYVAELAKLGYIETTKKKKRNIELTEDLSIINCNIPIVNSDNKSLNLFELMRISVLVRRDIDTSDYYFICKPQESYEIDEIVVVFGDRFQGAGKEYFTFKFSDHEAFASWKIIGKYLGQIKLELDSYTPIEIDEYNLIMKRSYR